MNETVRFKEVITEQGLKTFEVKHIYDRVAEEIDFKQENDSNFLPLNAVIKGKTEKQENEKFNEKLVEGFVFVEDNKDDSLSQIRSKMLVSQLNAILKSKNDIIKYGYIEMIRNGNEEELMKYLLNEPKDKKNEFNAELEKKIRRKQAKLFNSKKINSFNTFQEEQNLIGKTKEIQQKLMSDIPKNTLKKIEISLRATDRILGNSIEYYESLKTKESKEKEKGYLSIFEDTDIYQVKKYNKFIEQASKRDERINQAKIKRDNLKKIKNEEILKNIHKKSIDYKKKLAKIRVQSEVFKEKLNKILVCFNVNLIIELLNLIADEG